MRINQCHQTTKHTVWHATECEPAHRALHLLPSSQRRCVFWQLSLEFCRVFVVSALAHHKLQRMPRYLIAKATTKRTNELTWLHLCTHSPALLHMCVVVCVRHWMVHAFILLRCISYRIGNCADMSHKRFFRSTTQFIIFIKLHKHTRFFTHTHIHTYLHIRALANKQHRLTRMRARISRSHCLSKVASATAATTNLAMATVVSVGRQPLCDFAATTMANGQLTLLRHSFGGWMMRSQLVVGRRPVSVYIAIDALISWHYKINAIPIAMRDTSSHMQRNVQQRRSASLSLSLSPLAILCYWFLFCPFFTYLFLVFVWISSFLFSLCDSAWIPWA